MQLVLDTRGLEMKKRNGCFYLKTDSKERIISPIKISSIAITAECTLTTAAIKLAVEHRIPIYIIDALGRTIGQFWSPHFGHLASLRRQQAVWATTPQATAWIVGVYELKLQRQADNLQWLSRQPNVKWPNGRVLLSTNETIMKLQQGVSAPISQIADTLRGYEAAYAKSYWQTLGRTMPEPMNFESRSQHPASDRFNALLNYTYGMLYTTIETITFSAGLDPYMGVFHADQYNKPTLVYDLIEPFRPWADRFLIDLVLCTDFSKGCFKFAENEVTLDKRGKQLLIPAYNRWVKSYQTVVEQRLSVKNHIAKFIYHFTKLLQQNL